MRLAVIATLYGERGTARLPALIEALAKQTRRADVVYFMCEDVDTRGLMARNPDTYPTAARWPEVFNWPTPRDDSGRYTVIPYSHKINRALDSIAHWASDNTYVTYLTDDSIPHPEKYERMVRALDEHPAVYVGQRRNGSEHPADRIVEDAYCVLDHTQVAHRLTADRWPTETGDMLLGDAVFWRRLHESLGPFYPVEGGILDEVQQTPDGITATWR